MSMLTVQRPCTGSNLFVPTVNTSFPYLSGYSLPGLAGTGNSLHGWKARNSTSQRVCNQGFGRKIQSQGFPLPGRLIGSILRFDTHSLKDQYPPGHWRSQHTSRSRSVFTQVHHVATFFFLFFLHIPRFCHKDLHLLLSSTNTLRIMSSASRNQTKKVVPVF